MNQTLKFEWDPAKNHYNQREPFEEAERAFYDPARIILKDIKHSEFEDRLFCYGMVKGQVMTVRFTMRGEIIRIIGAACWRDGREMYEEENNL